MINYHNRQFSSVRNSENGDVSEATEFHYTQAGNIVSAKYAGGKIIEGHLIGVVDQEGNIDMRYHHVNDQGLLMTGICHSVPEVLTDGRVRLHESWQWTSGDMSSGESIVEEVS